MVSHTGGLCARTPHISLEPGTCTASRTSRTLPIRTRFSLPRVMSVVKRRSAMKHFPAQAELTNAVIIAMTTFPSLLLGVVGVA